MLNVKSLGTAAAVAAGISLSIGSVVPAKAACLSPNCKTVTYQGTSYDVSKLTGTFNSLESTLTQQIWWGSSSAASTFAGLIGGDLGFPNVGNNFSLGPLFAFAAPLTQGGGLFAYGSADGSNPTILGPFVSGHSVEQTFAVATPAVAIPTPALLPSLIGLSAVVIRKRKGEVTKESADLTEA